MTGPPESRSHPPPVSTAAAIAQQLPGGKRRAAYGLGAEAGKAWLSRPWVLTISLLDRGRNRCRCRAFLCQQKPNAMGDKRS